MTPPPPPLPLPYKQIPRAIWVIKTILLRNAGDCGFLSTAGAVFGRLRSLSAGFARFREILVQLRRGAGGAGECDDVTGGFRNFTAANDILPLPSNRVAQTVV